MLTREKLNAQSLALETAPLEDILIWSWETLGSRVAFGTAFGASGMVLLGRDAKGCATNSRIYN